MLAAFLSPETLEMLLEALPIIISLIIIEGLLSVDNALAIAAMASHLPGKQKYWALRAGIVGAYLFRGIALLLAEYIIANPWLKLIGAAYLLHLMCHHFAGLYRRNEEGSEEEGSSAAKGIGRGFWMTVASIELMDLSLGVDNIVAAVALSDEFWVVCTGVFIGILALRFIAGRCIRLIERFPILEHTAFLLIGFVGCLLLFELSFHRDITTLTKFLGIVAIIAFTIWYSKSATLTRIIAPLNRIAMWPIRFYDFILSGIFSILFAPFRLLFRKRNAPEAELPR